MFRIFLRIKWHEETSLTEKIRHWREGSRRSSSLPSKEGWIFKVLKLEVWSTQVKNEKSQAVLNAGTIQKLVSGILKTFKNQPTGANSCNSCQPCGAVALSCSSTSGDDSMTMEFNCCVWTKASPHTSASTSTWMPYQKNRSVLLINCSQHKQTSSLFGSVTIFPDLCAILLTNHKNQLESTVLLAHVAFKSKANELCQLSKADLSVLANFLRGRPWCFASCGPRMGRWILSSRTH